MRLKSSDTGAWGQTAYRLHVWFILQGEKNTLYFFLPITRYFLHIFDPLLSVITTPHTVSLHLSPPTVCPPVCVCWGCLRAYICTHSGEKGASYIRFGRGSTIRLTCWGRRLEWETQNVFSITLSSHSCSNWFFKSTHRSACTADSWEGGVENCHYQAKDSNSHM